MPVPTLLTDLSTTPASNFPAGSESPGTLDDYMRAHAALMATLRDRWSAFGLTLTDDADAAAALTTLGVSAYIQTLLNDADAATARTTLGVPSSSGSLSGLRNLIINGNFAVNQRAYVSGTNTTGANQYTLDRWRVVTSGQNITFTTSGNGRLVTAPAGGLEQVIEGANVYGGTYVINWTGTATCTVDGVARAKGDTFTLTAATNATVKFSSGTVGDVQVENGTVATAFEQRPYGFELELCKRYYQTGLARLSSYAGAVSTFDYRVLFPVEMRAAPTMSNSFSYVNANSGTTFSAADGCIHQAAATGSGAVNFSNTYTATAEL